MNKDELQNIIQKAIKEAHISGIQSGKKETSGLVDDIIKRIEPAVEKSIDKYVNGRISVISQKLDDYIISDLKWKETADPVIEMGQNVSGFGKVSLYILGFLAAVAGAILAFTSIFKQK